MNKDGRRLLVLLLFLPVAVAGQHLSFLEGYINEGLKNNIVLQQRVISYEKALNDLETAKSLWLPTVSFLTTYSHGEGGRAIAVPVGDLMNPVYSTLNQILSQNVFPQISNVEEGFLPLRFYDARIRTTMPILNPEIGYNRDIQEGKLKISEQEISLFKKDLVKEIKTAYWNYLASLEAISIHLSSRELAKEAKKSAESLVANGKGLPLHQLRAESEIEGINALIADAKATSANAQRYFNFLINRDLDSPIDIDTLSEVQLSEKIAEEDPGQREEVEMLRTAREINRSILELNRSHWIPRISGMLDLGSQNSDWKIDKGSWYYFFGIELELPLFEGFRSKYKIESAELDIKNLDLEIKGTTKALQLSLSVAKNNLETARQNYTSALSLLKTATAYNRLAEKAWREGAGTFIETVDAREQLIKAQLNANICKYRVMTALAEYERQSLTQKTRN